MQDAYIYDEPPGCAAQFTGKERDTETGLDYFGARFYGSNMGRFTSPDPLFMKRERLFDPQQLNLYSYVRNNPLKFIDPEGLSLVVYYFNAKDLTDQQKKFLQQNQSKIFAAIAEKYKKAGIKDVQFRDASTLTKSQIESIQKNAPTGVALLGFANKSFADKSSGGAFGATDSKNPTSVVFLGNVVNGSLITSASKDDATTAFRAAEVGSHELGHAVHFDSNQFINYLTAGIADFLSSNIMHENQGIPTRSKSFDTSSDINKRVIEEINSIGDNTPKP